MKKTVVFGIILIMILWITGCASNANSNIEPIIGTWNLITPVSDDDGNTIDHIIQYKFIFEDKNTGKWIATNNDQTKGLTWEEESDNKYKVILSGGKLDHVDNDGNVIFIDSVAEAEIISDGSLKFIWNDKEVTLTK